MRLRYTRDVAAGSHETELNRPGGKDAPASGTRPHDPRPGHRAPTRPTRRRSLRFRRIRALAILTVLIAVLLLALSLSSGGPNNRRLTAPTSARHRAYAGAKASTPARAVTVNGNPPAVEAGELPWSLPNPISRLTLLPGSGPTDLVIAGGTLVSGGSASGVYTVDTTSGHLTWVANLAAPTHDASGALLGNRYLIFGGGSTTSTPSVQSLPTSDLASQTSSASGPPSLVATIVGNLPEPRSDSSALVLGGTAYVIAGYNGTAGDRSVLATTSGAAFRTVGELPVGVRYAAVAALGRRVLVFGGLATAGSQAGQPLRTVQEIDLTTGRARVIGELPEPLYGAAAANLGGTIYITGGMTPSSGPAANPQGMRPVGSIWAYDPKSAAFLLAGHLRVPVGHAGAAVLGARLWLVGGESTGGTPTSAVQVVQPNRTFGNAGSPGAGSPYFGEKLLVADEGNDRLVLLSDTSKIVWTFPSASAPAPPGGFSADDAFFARHGTMIVTNEETKDVLAEIAYPSGRLLWTYGHLGVPSGAPGYLNTPDDAYLLPDGNVVTADIANCRVIVIDPKTDQIISQIGTTGRCIHDMDSPIALGSPNGDTPLPNGNILVSEINGSYVDEFTPAGKPLWSVHLPISYPSDPQQIGPDRYLIAGYTKPGSLLEFNKQGKVLYRYQPTSGPGMLDHPSLVEMLPNGILMLNDDYNDRMIAIDPSTGALVWQYGVTHTPGSAPGMLNEPDGFDILAPGGTTPTHTGTG